MDWIVWVGLGILAFVLGFWVTQRWQGGPSRSQSLPPPSSRLRLPQGNTPKVLPPDWEREIASILQTQGTIPALKRLRQQAGLSLREAKVIVDRLAAQDLSAQDLPTSNQRRGSPAPTTQDALDMLSLVDLGLATPADVQELVPRVQQLLGERRKIEAIKQVRMKTGWGLKRAKVFVERVERSLG